MRHVRDLGLVVFLDADSQDILERLEVSFVCKLEFFVAFLDLGSCQLRNSITQQRLQQADKTIRDSKPLEETNTIMIFAF